MNIEAWEELLKAQRILIGDIDVLTGPPDMDVTREIMNGMARLTVLLDIQTERVKQMELGNNYTMVSKWIRTAQRELHSLGQGSFGITKVLRKFGY